MGLRELVVTLIIALGLYLLSLVWRWLRLSSKAKPQARPEYLNESIDSIPTLMPGLTSAGRDMLMGQEPADGDASVHSAAEPARHRGPAEPGTSSLGFDALLEMQQTRRIVDTLRNEQVKLREEVACLRADVAALNAVLGTERRTAVHVSPVYDEAVGLAHRGMDAQVIAAQCGISVSEAELVRAIAATQQPRESEHG